MRRLWACLLLLCVGIALPAVGGHAHICLAEWIANTPHHGDCCCDEGGNRPEKSECCIELERLPDGLQPAPQPVVPPAPVLDLNLLETWPPQERIVSPGRGGQAERIRGPAPPSVRRALLAVWRN